MAPLAAAPPPPFRSENYGQRHGGVVHAKEGKAKRALLPLHCPGFKCDSPRHWGNFSTCRPRKSIALLSVGSNIECPEQICALSPIHSAVLHVQPLLAFACCVVMQVTYKMTRSMAMKQ